MTADTAAVVEGDKRVRDKHSQAAHTEDDRLRSQGIRNRGSKMIPIHHGQKLSSEEKQGEGSMNITDFTVTIPSSTKSGSSSKATSIQTADTSGNATTKSGRWHTKEFRFYYVMFVIIVPLMIYWPMKLSSVSHPNYPAYSWRLSQGWLFGWKVDNSDHQYSTFRSNLPALLTLASIHLLSSYAQSRFSTTPQTRAKFMAGFSIIVLVILHGLSIFKIAIILYLNYYLTKAVKPSFVGRLWPALVVVGNMGILFFNERYEGYQYASIHSIFSGLDQLNGVYPRWHISFNITMLRLVSFDLDYHWREQTTSSETPIDYRRRVTKPHAEDDYSLVNFIAYCLYPPLYIAGPIMTFNDFLWQLKRPVTITIREKVSYAIRFIFCLLTMESVLHTMYVVAIKDSSAWYGDSPADLCMIGFWNLVIVWLKLLIPWRFFRLWAILDGMDPPENMVRCVANNYSTLGFWRSWHRSYNLWVVRYIYIPVGGSKNVILATLLVFTFVAMWHDLSFKLLAWGWLISLFILPELLARKLAPESKYGHSPWYRHIAAIGGVGNVLMMMTANLVGFVLGVDGMKHLLKEMVSTWSGLAFGLFASSMLFIGVQVMFEYREEELRRGIDRKC